jgi:cytochrome c oxidase subunit 2
LAGLAAAGAILLGGCAGAPSTLDPRGPEASRVATLWWLMFAVAVVVFVVVTALLLIAVARARRPEAQNDARPHDRRALILVLIGGALAPAVVLVIMMAISIGIEQAGAAAAGADQTVEVIGHEWWWEVRYPERNIVTANEIHIPVGKRVLVKLTTADVIHSFWVPQLHGKIDLIPGQTNSVWMEAAQAGAYRGECAEYCGLQHAHMDFVVIADTQGDFDAWVAQQQRPAPPISATNPLLMQGQQAFLGSACVYCHTIRGTNASGTLGPDLTHLASRTTIGAGILPNTRGNLAGWIVNSQVMKPGNHMPPMYLDPDQLQAMLDYLESLK